MKSLYVFDLDGVLIDSEENMRKSFDSLNTGRDFKDYFKLIGKPFKDILTGMGILTDQDELMIKYNQFSSKNSKLIKFYDGVEEHLQHLKSQGKKLAVVTSKHKDRTHDILSKLDVEFDFVCCPTEGLRGKPSPDQLLYTLAHCNTSPKDAVYVGDMIVDKECADASGVDFIHAEYGYGEVECWNKAKTIQSV